MKIKFLIPLLFLPLLLSGYSVVFADDYYEGEYSTMRSCISATHSRFGDSTVVARDSSKKYLAKIDDKIHFSCTRRETGSRSVYYEAFITVKTEAVKKETSPASNKQKKGMSNQVKGWLLIVAFIVVVNLVRGVPESEKDKNSGAKESKIRQPRRKGAWIFELSAPAGLQWGQTQDDIKAQGVNLYNCETDEFGITVCKTKNPPTSLSFADHYILSFLPELQKVIAVGNEPDDPFGNDSQFASLRRSLTKMYGILRNIRLAGTNLVYGGLLLLEISIKGNIKLTYQSDDYLVLLAEVKAKKAKKDSPGL